MLYGGQANSDLLHSKRPSGLPFFYCNISFDFKNLQSITPNKKVLYTFMLSILRIYWETPLWNVSPYVQPIFDLILDIANHYFYATNQPAVSNKQMSYTLHLCCCLPRWSCHRKSSRKLSLTRTS